jgi:S1-C subfamily serine protease
MRRSIECVLGFILVLTLCGTWAKADPAANGEEDSVRVFRDLQPSVVSLQNAEGSGTGIIIDASGLILTNAHVVISPLPFKCVADAISGPGETRQVEFKKVQVVGFHPHLDLALVRVDPKEVGAKLKPAIFASAKPSPGQHIFVIGDPAGGGMVLTKTITAGMLSAVDREVEGEHYDQIDAAINPGNSGGPVADRLNSSSEYRKCVT